MTTVVKLAIALLTGLLGLLAAVTESRDDNGRLTRSGKILAAAIVISSLLSIWLLSQEHAEQSRRDIEAQRQYALTVARHELALKHLHDLITRHESLAQRSEESVARLAKVDAVLTAATRKADDIQKSSLSNLAVTQRVMTDVNKLSLPFTLAAVEMRVQISTAEPSIRAWIDRLKVDARLIESRLDPDAVGGFMEKGVTFLHSEGTVTHIVVAPAGWNTATQSPWLPRDDATERRAHWLLRPTNVRLAFRAAASTADDLVYKVDTEWLRPTEAALQAAEPSLRRKYKNYPFAHFVIDLSRKTVTRHVLVRSPEITSVTGRIRSVLDLSDGLVAVTSGPGETVTFLRLYPNDTLATCYDVPLQSRPRRASASTGRIEVTIPRLIYAHTAE